VRGQRTGLVEVLAARPLLMESASLDVDEQRGCFELLDDLRGRHLDDALASLLLPLAHPENRRPLEQLLRRLPSTAVFRLLTQQARKRPDRGPGLLSDLCDEHAAGLLRHHLSLSRPSTHDVMTLVRELLAVSRSHDHPLAAQILGALSSPMRSDPIRIAEATANLANPQLRSTLADLAVDRAVAAIKRWSDVGAVWSELRRQDPDAVEPELLRRLLRTAARNAGGAGNELLLGWTATEVLARDRSLFTFSGRIRDDDIQDMCLRIARQASLRRLQEQDPAIAQTSKRVQQWWSDLCGICWIEARRASHQSRGSGRWWLA
jgi:hypothetical protein